MQWKFSPKKEKFTPQEYKVFYLIHNLPRLLIQGLIPSATTTKFSLCRITFEGRKISYNSSIIYIDYTKIIEGEKEKKNNCKNKPLLL